jgi:hypothetical protein
MTDFPICICGHEYDEHDSDEACTVADCPCFHYEDAPEDDEE